MLCLTRRVDDRLFIRTGSGELITVMVVDLLGDKVKLGIDAPPSVVIERDDMLKGKVNHENRR